MFAATFFRHAAVPTRALRLLPLVCALALPWPARSAYAQMPAPPVRGELLIEAARLFPGETVRVGVQLVVAPGWHIYWKQPGDAGFATEVALESGDASFGPLSWPAPKVFHENDKVTTYGYTDQVMLVAPMTLQDSVQGSLTVSAQARYLACNATCSPGQLKLTRAIEVGAEHREAEPVVAAAFAQFDAAMQAPAPERDTSPRWRRLLEVLLAAFCGGMLLNAMPCVLPVLALKAASLAQMGQDARRARRHGWAYALGVVASMEVLACAVLLARALGHQVGWGFQMQQPLFVAGVAVALVLFAANCLGAFELTPALGGLAAAHDRAHGLRRSVLEGVLAVLVATPCSTPFLGSAVAFALGQGPLVVVATFAAVGAGLAAPYVAMTQIPASRRLLPRPGAWMLGLKVGLGYCLLATAAWLAWVLDRAQGPDAMAALLVWAWVAAVGASILGAVLRRLPERGGLGLSCLLALLVAVGGQLWPLLEGEAAAASPDAQVARAYSEEAVAEGLAAGHPVFVDFTADWCVTCRYNERHVLADARLQKAFARRKVVLLRADWTRRDEAILRKLQVHGRAGVPMYLLYKPNAPTPQLLPEVLSVSTVLQALGEG